MRQDFVKTSDLKGRRPMRDPFGNGAQWVFCDECYGREMKDHLTRNADGVVCPKCDGAGTLWRVWRNTEGGE